MNKEELKQIIKADDLHIAPFREDGVTHGTPTWIWAVTVDDMLFVRAYSGKNSRWYKAAVQQKAGIITAAGMTKKVRFETVGHDMDLRITAAYREKYSGSPYLGAMISPRACEATIRIKEDQSQQGQLN